MKKVLLHSGVITLLSTYSIASNLSGQIRMGYVNDINYDVTSAVGLRISYDKNISDDIKLHSTVNSTNHIGKYNNATEFRLLDEVQEDYLILNEAYVELSKNNMIIKIGRQVVDIPYLDSDDIGMIPNTFSGFGIENNLLENTKLYASCFNKWSGIDSDFPAKFTSMQIDDYIKLYGIEYDGIKNLESQLYYYDLKDENYNYLEISYNLDFMNIASQYSNQSSNSVIGLMADTTYENFTFTTAYNNVDGTISNGFGGGPFFTSSEDHTIADQLNQVALLTSLSYEFGQASTSISYVDFNIGENEVDYTFAYNINDKTTLDIIYSNMYDDGEMTRVYLNYLF